MQKSFILLILFILAGCALKPPMPEVHTDFNATQQKAEIKDNWWENFHDTKLNGLIENALKNSSDLKILRTNLLKARQTLELQGANNYPTLSFSAGVSKNQTSGENASHAPQMSLRDNSIKALLSYEFDLWGRVENSIQASKASFIGTKYDYYNAKTSYVAHLASTYFSLVALKKKQAIVKKTIENYTKTMNYRKTQFNEGAVNEVVYLQSKAELQKAKIRLNNVNKNIQTKHAALAILSQRGLNDILYKDSNVSEDLPSEPVVPEGISSDILKKRADVASAYKKIQSANFLVGVAKSQYYPSFSLTGALGFQSESLDRLFVSNASIWSLAGNLAGKIFDFGRTDAKVALANLEQNLTVINYEKTLKNALFEARNALIQRAYAKENRTHFQTLINSLKKINSLSKDMYQEGYITHLELLDSQRALLDAKVQYIDAKLAVINAIVNIYKAFGGGFEPLEEE